MQRPPTASRSNVEVLPVLVNRATRVTARARWGTAARHSSAAVLGRSWRRCGHRPARTGPRRCAGTPRPPVPPRPATGPCPRTGPGRAAAGRTSRPACRRASALRLPPGPAGRPRSASTPPPRLPRTRRSGSSGRRSAGHGDGRGQAARVLGVRCRGHLRIVPALAARWGLFGPAVGVSRHPSVPGDAGLWARRGSGRVALGAQPLAVRSGGEAGCGVEKYGQAQVLTGPQGPGPCGSEEESGAVECGGVTVTAVGAISGRNWGMFRSAPKAVSPLPRPVSSGADPGPQAEARISPRCAGRAAPRTPGQARTHAPRRGRSSSRGHRE